MEVKKERETCVLIGLYEIIALLEEYQMKMSVLRTSPYVKNFFERLIELSKTIKLVLEIVNEWITFQNNWIYLDNIFKLEEISR